MTDNLISIHELKKYWSSPFQLALDIPNLHIRTAEKIAILGPSGSGKTTFFFGTDNTLGSAEKYLIEVSPSDILTNFSEKSTYER